jgi:hypothetical protein
MSATWVLFALRIANLDLITATSSKYDCSGPEFSVISLVTTQAELSYSAVKPVSSLWCGYKRGRVKRRRHIHNGRSD